MATLGMVLMVIAGLLSLVGGVMFIVAAFRVSALWGVVVLFVPFAGLVFAFKYWEEAKRGFLISLAGGVLSPIAAFVVFSGMMSGMGEQMAEQAALQMQQEMASQAGAASGSAGMEPSPSPEPAARTPSVQAEPASAVPASSDASPSGSDAAWSDRGNETDVVRAAATSPKVKINPIDSLPIDSAAGGAGQDAPASYEPIPLRSAGQHIGERLEFVRTDGRIFSAELVAVEGGRLRVRRDVPGGTLVYPVQSTNIAKLRPSR